MAIDIEDALGLAIPAAAVGGMYLLKQQGGPRPTGGRARITGALGNCGNITIAPPNGFNVSINYEWDLTEQTDIKLVVSSPAITGTYSTTATKPAGSDSDAAVVMVMQTDLTTGTYDVNLEVYCPADASSPDDTFTCTDALTLSTAAVASITGGTVSS